MILRPCDGGCTLSVRIHPGAKCDAITGTHNGALKISVTAAPSDGRANAALVAFLAKRLDIPRLSIELISGSSNRTKTFRLSGIKIGRAHV